MMRTIQKIGLSILLFIGMVISLYGQQTVRFEGTVVGPWQGHSIGLYNNITGDRDSAIIENGKFVIELPYTIPTRHLFYSTYDTKVKGGYAPFGILVDKPGSIQVELDIEKGFIASKVSGSEPHDLYTGLMAKLGSVQAEDSRGDVIKEWVEKNRESYAVVFVLDRFGGDVDVDTRSILFESLPQDLKDLHEGKKVASKILGERSAAIGQVVQNFELKRPDDTSFSFEDLKGKYVFIDFWASWCGPCIQEFPHIKQVYETYKDQGFEVLGISTDKNKDAWLKALENHDIPWIQVRDNEGEEAIALSQFAVTVLPTSFLVDPDGRIIAKNLRGDALMQKIKELFN